MATGTTDGDDVGAHSRPATGCFHCHLIAHILAVMRAPYAALGLSRRRGNACGESRVREYALDGSSVGIVVSPRAGVARTAARCAAARAAAVRAETGSVFSNGGGVRVRVTGDSVPPSRDSIRIPGSPIVLQRGERVVLTLPTGNGQLVSCTARHRGGELLRWSRGLERRGSHYGAADRAGGFLRRTSES